MLSSRFSMRLLLILLVALMTANLVIAGRKKFFLKEWLKYKREHNKIYTKIEEKMRLRLFMRNLVRILTHNERHKKGEELFRMDSTRFLDWLPEETTKIKGLKMPANFKEAFKNQSRKMPYFRKNVPKEVDWVKSGYVTSVKDQGSCGGCYAFSAAAAMEGLMYRRRKKLVDISVQNLIDCTKDFDNNGCNGGLIHPCFDYANQNKGVNLFKPYPYKGEAGTCHFNKRKGKFSGVKGFVIVDSPGDEEVLKTAVANIGPIGVGIHAEDNFLYYSGGIYSSKHCNKTINHAILIVGYGTDNETGKDYWLIKNSWGTKWGIDGYGKVLRNGGNMCHISDYAVYPV